ncbi:MAG: DUF1761 domain-containing protein [Pseudomonadales bacterium]
MVELNFVAIILATLSAFVVGALWYGPLFGKAWMEEFNITEQDIEQENKLRVYGLSFALAFIVAFGLDFFILGEHTGWMEGAEIGAIAGLGLLAPYTGIHYLFEGRSMRAFLINAGFNVVTLMVMGAILGWWTWAPFSF